MARKQRTGAAAYFCLFLSCELQAAALVKISSMFSFTTAICCSCRPSMANVPGCGRFIDVRRGFSPSHRSFRKMSSENGKIFSEKAFPKLIFNLK